jgi:hypothetical protein
MEHVALRTDNFLSSNESSNNNLSLETENSMRYTDENQNILPDNQALRHHHQPVKFVS